MRVITSEIFRFLTPAGPRQVWKELTRTGEPCAHLLGLTAETDWRPGSALTATVSASPANPAGPEHPDSTVITGQILRSEPPLVLSYSLGEGPGGFPVYVTWEVEPSRVGTIVRLYVDETGPIVSPGPELTWLPVMEAFRAVVGHSLEFLKDPESLIERGHREHGNICSCCRGDHGRCSRQR